MLYLKNKYFTRWARKEGVSDQMLKEAIGEFEKGLFEASLGNHLFKKRVALSGRGKSSGARTILFYQQGKKLIFCFGFSKNEQDNINRTQSAFLHKLSDIYQEMTEENVVKNMKYKELVLIPKAEVNNEK